MKFFQIAKTNLIFLGFRSNHLFQKYLFNGKLSIGLLFYAFILISDIMFILFEAEIIRQYLDTFYMAATIAALTISFVNLVIKTDLVFGFILKCEKIADKSKLISNVTKMLIQV